MDSTAARDRVTRVVGRISAKRRFARSLLRFFRQSLRRGALLLPVALAACIGPPVQVVPNEHSQGRSEAEVTADLAHCEEIAGEVLHEYGPHPPYSDDPFADAATLRGHRTRYEAACMRVKGYQVQGSLRNEISPVDLPASAVEKARSWQGDQGASE